MDTRILIPAKDAVIFWNDNPIPYANCVRVVSINDPRMDQLGRGFENSMGAIISEWMTRPEATPRWVFCDFMDAEAVKSLDPADWGDVQEAWLSEFAKIEGCDWAMQELQALSSDDDVVSPVAIDMFEVLSGMAKIALLNLTDRLRKLPDEHFGEFCGLVHSEWDVLGAVSPSWINLLMEAVEKETDQRRPRRKLGAHVCFLTHDINWVARCASTGVTASGHTKEAAEQNLRTLIEGSAQ